MRWALLVASLVAAAAGLVRLGNPAGTGDDAASVIRLPSSIAFAITALFAFAALVFLLGLMRRMRSKRHGEDEMFERGAEPARRSPWMQTLAQLMTIVNFLVIGYLLWTRVLPIDALMALGQGVGAAGLAEAPAPSAPFLVTWTFALVAFLAGAMALVLAVWFTTGDRLAQWWTRRTEEPEAAPEPLIAAVDDSLEDLRAESDARRAIIRCYARFERAAAAAGSARLPWHTPMEFMREVLARLPAPAAVRVLTGLFELARFSNRALGLQDRDRAVDALDDIKAAITTVDGACDVKVHVAR